MRQVYISGAGLTPFGRHDGRDSLSLMSCAAREALSEAGVSRGEVNGLITGYSTTLPHLMLATLFSEHFGLRPAYANALQMGGATGAAQIMLGALLIASGQCETVLVVAGENRLTHVGGRDQAIKTLAQVGHADHEVPFGATIPGYYALLARDYLTRTGAETADLAALAVLMRSHARATPGAHLTEPLSLEQALSAREIASPLRLTDCCPISDGAAALVLSAKPGPVRLAGAGQAHHHQHVSVADLDNMGGAVASARAFAQSGIGAQDVDILGIYDSFTITLALLLEDCGFAPRGQAGQMAAAGAFSEGGRHLNPHGGLLSYGHCGVAGGLAHLISVSRAMAAGRARRGYVHADGGVLSAHVGLVLMAE